MVQRQELKHMTRMLEKHNETLNAMIQQYRNIASIVNNMHEWEKKSQLSDVLIRLSGDMKTAMLHVQELAHSCKTLTSS